ncbi:MAG: MaoC family dehydratase [Lachnospiraceae bacterium]|nr:MaoC family dehydratase [Lachnospiraceae bacterium]
MNEYRFEDLQIGLKESFVCTITQEMMEDFRRLTGDVNPLHLDSQYAVEHGFKGSVVYGMLSASLISTLGGVYLPGKYCLIQQVETKFVKPVYVGDVLTVYGTVQELNDTVRQAVIKVEIKRDTEKVVRGCLKVGFLE